ncbi:hypothetical protein BCR41DRAFT_97858 [Lobosporangium transversale]|uniref:Uncharacterized protein n=1 Tax=Lobosporangium transversale TaxID=64571 RepID=A0A1Y2GNT2_9FUNG|nr:hypothetical protein BCR41DRAFT_97858 [Lobosporangium transversale]ORZ12924.1 hypothetical protein BCR41DRAFT_97858 [Lobosporangium transversale]|eukprot:XP_021880273.1 hypothetical protein BCR41DRAFT_97858 [Lobosporangium transversale]
MSIKTISFALMALLPFLANPVASQGQNPINQDGCVTNYDPNFDYFTNKITVDNATLFSVHYERNYKVVVNNALKKEYVLTQCGTPVPPASQFGNETVFVNIPVKNAASTATTAVAFIEMLGMRSALKAVDTEGLISSPCLQYDLERGSILGIEDKDLAKRADQFKSVDVVFSTFGSEPGMENKTVITSEVSDPGPLHVAAP